MFANASAAGDDNNIKAQAITRADRRGSLNVLALLVMVFSEVATRELFP